MNDNLEPDYKKKADQARELFYAAASHSNMSFRKRWWQRKSEFEKFIDVLTSFDHNYNTICHAVTAAALAAARSLNREPCGGITGFQASYVMWQFVTQWMHLGDAPLKLMNFEQMLYPQHEDRFTNEISAETWQYLQEQAKLKMGTVEAPHPNVAAHWQSIIDGKVPFGYRLTAVDGPQPEPKE